MKEKMVPQEFEDWFEDNGMDSIETMAEIFKIQQQGAIELTRLVLEHANEEKKTKAYVFKIYEEALKLVTSELNKDF